jgi:hypothetical protein
MLEFFLMLFFLFGDESGLALVNGQFVVFGSLFGKFLLHLADDSAEGRHLAFKTHKFALSDGRFGEELFGVLKFFEPFIVFDGHSFVNDFSVFLDFVSDGKKHLLGRIVGRKAFSGVC